MADLKVGDKIIVEAPVPAGFPDLKPLKKNATVVSVDGEQVTITLDDPKIVPLAWCTLKPTV